MSVPLALVADPERTFLDNLPLIERILSIIARRHALSRTDAEDFGAWAREHLIADDYLAIRKFGGRSSLATYLSVVLSNSFHDYRNARWGRWRPSASATRLGPVGVKLEELLYRDGHSVREAAAILQGRGANLSDGEVARLAARIPARSSVAEVGLEAADEASMSSPEASSLSDDDAVVIAALRTVMNQLPAEEQVIMRMRFWDEVSVADIARALRLDQKPLYRKLESIQHRLRAALEERGIDRARAAELLAGGSA
jgi:RNA polymerase sigma factor for flagellar operon FliA